MATITPVIKPQRDHPTRLQTLHPLHHHLIHQATCPHQRLVPLVPWWHPHSFTKGEGDECLLMFWTKIIFPFRVYQRLLDGELGGFLNLLAYLRDQEYPYPRQIKEMGDICHRLQQPPELIDCVEVFDKSKFLLILPRISFCNDALLLFAHLYYNLI